MLINIHLSLQLDGIKMPYNTIPINKSAIIEDKEIYDNSRNTK